MVESCLAIAADQHRQSCKIAAELQAEKEAQKQQKARIVNLIRELTTPHWRGTSCIIPSRSRGNRERTLIATRAVIQAMPDVLGGVRFTSGLLVHD